MRIIDADRAKEIVDTSVGDFLLALAMRNLLDRVPTEDAAPVVHGQYITYDEQTEWYGTVHVCLECETQMMLSKGCNPVVPKLCPNCGAQLGERSQEQ